MFVDAVWHLIGVSLVAWPPIIPSGSRNVRVCHAFASPVQAAAVPLKSGKMKALAQPGVVRRERLATGKRKCMATTRDNRYRRRNRR